MTKARLWGLDCLVRYNKRTALKSDQMERSDICDWSEGGKCGGKTKFCLTGKMSNEPTLSTVALVTDK